MLDFSRPGQPSRSRIAELVLDSSADFAILTTDLDGIITTWNGAAKRVMGWSEEEVVGRDACIIFTPEDQEEGACAAEMAQARSSGRAADERWHIRKDGSRFWGAGSMAPLRDEATSEHLGYIKIVRDRTEQHLAGERLRASEAMLRGVLESSADCLKLLTTDGRLTFMNGPGLCTMEIEDFGSVRGEEWVSLWPEGEREKIRAALADAAAGRVGRFRGFCATARGTPKWWDVQVTAVPGADGRPELLLASSRDVTEGERSREALRLSEARLRGALSISTVGVMFWGPDFDLTEVNDAFLRMTGFSREEAIGRTWQDLTPPEFYAHSAKAIEEVTTLSETTPYEKQYYRKDGSRWWGLFAARRIGDEVVEFALDVTDRKQAEEELRRLNEHLEVEVARRAEQLRRQEDILRQSQKLEAVGQLTGGVAHDFNNLLTVIRSAADLLRRSDLPEDRRQRYVGAIADTASRAAKLTGQLLAFARRQPLKPEVFAVGERLQAVADLVRPLVGARIEIETVIECEGCTVEADPNQFETALVNLAVNARDAMSGEGCLTLKTWLACEVPSTRGHASAPGAFVAVSVSDTGSGMASEMLGRIFEPFFTTKEVGKGTGLGLSQVYGFAKQSGGEIDVDSEVGRGTTFTLYLPRAEAKAVVAPSQPQEGADPPTAGRRNVLLVEDNTQVGEFARQMLEDLGHEATLAPNARAALKLLEEDAGRFDVVFSDVVMPGMNGVELGREIRLRWPNVPIILTSGYSHVLANGGAQEFELLHKPYSVEGLSRALRSRRHERD
ncbi:PAS domain S-box protein [Belnapia sp. T18]|uniref:histidine kinase n=1 Tax=Belnapia arida TaxID=2804533 RepID=A0ABS1U8W1_9PROT|nr:PAS domain S-box protein [Belnapia arida]MBL6081123.1 PAS domain S-box protein [Belnapia arida]